MIFLLKFMMSWLKRSDKVQLPSYIYIVVNNKCNLKCKMCDVGQNVDSQFYRNMVREPELTVEQWKFFIDDLCGVYSKESRPCIAITSTEPLMYKGLFDVIKYAKEKNFKVQLTTNGLLLPKYYKEVIESGVDDLWVSIDGPREVHNEIRGNPHVYDNAINGLKLIKSDEQYKILKLPNIYLNYTITDKNYLFLEKFIFDIIWHEEIPFKSVCYSHLNFVTQNMSSRSNQQYGDICVSTPTCISGIDFSVFTRRVADLLSVQTSSILKIYTEFASFSPNIVKSEDIYNFYNHPEKYISNHTQCTTPWRAAQIFCNGDVGVSTRCFNLSFGNITKESFSDIWNGERINSFRKSLSKTENGSFPACTRCCSVF